jgi:acyl carrier protein
MMSTTMSESSNDRATQNSPRARLIDLIRQILGPPAASRPLPIDARLSDLGMSSIKMVNLMLAVEVEFAITIPQAEITPENFQSIASVEGLVLRLTEPATDS